MFAQLEAFWCAFPNSFRPLAQKLSIVSTRQLPKSAVEKLHSIKIFLPCQVNILWIQIISLNIHKGYTVSLYLPSIQRNVITSSKYKGLFFLNTCKWITSSLILPKKWLPTMMCHVWFPLRSDSQCRGKSQFTWKEISILKKVLLLVQRVGYRSPRPLMETKAKYEHGR